MKTITRPPIHVDVLIVNEAGDVVGTPGMYEGDVVPKSIAEIFSDEELEQVQQWMRSGEERELLFDDDLRARIRPLQGAWPGGDGLTLLELRHSGYFFSKLCHNIRTPLSTIMNLAECGLLHQDATAIHDLVDRIPDLVVSTSEMLENLQSYIDPPMTRRGVHTVRSLCDRGARGLRARGGGIDLVEGAELELTCDVEVLGRALEQIAGYLHQSGKADPVLRAEAREGAVHVEVSQPGVSRDEVDEVYFSGFARRVKGGAGLELLMASRLVTLSGGTLRLFLGDAGVLFSFRVTTT